jgi:hypothetical protein
VCSLELIGRVEWPVADYVRASRQVKRAGSMNERSRTKATTEITKKFHHGGTETRGRHGAWSAAGRWPARRGRGSPDTQTRVESVGLVCGRSSTSPPRRARADHVAIPIASRLIAANELVLSVRPRVSVPPWLHLSVPPQPPCASRSCQRPAAALSHRSPGRMDSRTSGLRPEAARACGVPRGTITKTPAVSGWSRPAMWMDPWPAIT